MAAGSGAGSTTRVGSSVAIEKARVRAELGRRKIGICVRTLKLEM